MIKRRRCDVPMAEKKGVLKYCDHNCELCVACIEISGSFLESHAPAEQLDLKRSKWRDSKLTKRNLALMSGEEV